MAKAKAKQASVPKLILVTAIAEGYMKDRIVKIGTRFRCPENALGMWMVRDDGKPIMRASKKIDYNNLTGDAVRSVLEEQTEIMRKMQAKLDGYERNADTAIKARQKEQELMASNEAQFDDDPAPAPDALDEVGSASPEELAQAQAQAASEAEDQGTDAL